MKKNIITFVAQLVVMALMYGITLWVFNIVFDDDPTFDICYAAQSLIFAVLIVSYQRWSDRKSSREEKSTPY